MAHHKNLVAKRFFLFTPLTAPGFARRLNKNLTNFVFRRTAKPTQDLYHGSYVDVVDPERDGLSAVLTGSILRNVDTKGLRRKLHCACGHTVAFHDLRGCGGVGMRDTPCHCTISDSAALDAAVRSFSGRSSRLLRRIRPLASARTVRRS
jgi:hypothetical protein